MFVSHVAVQLSSPRARRDKVLSYDLLKCPNATITRDYYKCIPRVQRAMSEAGQDATAGAEVQPGEKERELSECKSWQQIVLAPKLT